MPFQKFLLHIYFSGSMTFSRPNRPSYSSVRLDIRRRSQKVFAFAIAIVIAINSKLRIKLNLSSFRLNLIRQLASQFIDLIKFNLLSQFGSHQVKTSLFVGKIGLTLWLP
jgi:hypothetical protein